MANRKTISKKLRFEVFKRDSFTCQYCGKTAPDVILEVDHINPVSKGGTNDLLNLITSCRDCNRGKSDRKLSDDSMVTKQQKELEELQEKRNQIDMMLEWREELKSLDDDVAEILCAEFEKATGYGVKEHGKKQVKKWVKKYKLKDLLEAMDRSIIQYPNVYKAFDMIPRIAYYVANPETTIDTDLYYISGILNNRLYYYNKPVGINYLKRASKYIDKDYLTEVAKTVKNWTEFKEIMEYIIEIEAGYEQNNC
ncbi:HNH endonuclease [Anaerococcus sp. Marseille-P3625]|uniref:HNH endonuclease n=1 Tax=Anaerococcus sp. Marseille-P3625 TaxID=1977277 RepID=UPI000C07B666|nr:HNH endonuclease [Anaerococcus sp. Marseille-P3625]